MKRPVLAVYDYGMGGIWILLDARNPGEVEEKYPMLKAYETRPDWMSEAEEGEFIERIERTGYHWDLDEPPSGWLKKLVEDESARRKSR